MAHLPFTQAEIDLCFVPAHEQFTRAKARRERMSSAPRPLTKIHLEDVRIEPPVAVDVVPIAAAPVQTSTFDELIIELELKDTDGMKPIASSHAGHLIAKKLMSLCEEKHGLSRGDIPSTRRSKNFIAARDEFINALAYLSDWSLAMISRFVKRDHTTVLYAIKKHSSTPKYIAAYEERKERARISIEKRKVNRVEQIIKNPRWTPQKDAAVINMLASGMKHSQIAENLTGNHSPSSINSRVKRLRARGQL